MRPRYLQKLQHNFCKTVKNCGKNKQKYITEGIIYNTFGNFFSVFFSPKKPPIAAVEKYSGNIV